MLMSEEDEMKVTRYITFIVLIGAILLTGISSVYAGVIVGAASGPGLHVTPLIADDDLDFQVGIVRIHNTNDNLKIETEITGDWLITEIQIYAGSDPVLTRKGNPVLGKFPYKAEYYDEPTANHLLILDFEEDLDFSWGFPWEEDRIQNIAVHVDIVQLDEFGEVVAEEGAWALGPNEWEGDQWGWWLSYQMAHMKRGHFIDSPVAGISYVTPTSSGKTDESGGFDYFPGEGVG